MVGSFLNVCIARLPHGRSVVTPGSHCPNCGAPIRWSDNIPVLSYVMLGARCRACAARISPVYPIIEITTAAAFVAEYMAVGWQPLLLARLIFCASLIVL